MAIEPCSGHGLFILAFIVSSYSPSRAQLLEPKRRVQQLNYVLVDTHRTNPAQE